VQYANSNKMDPKKVGTTLECVLLMMNKAYIGHVGDSRIYLLGREGLKLITEDHSAVMQLVKAGIIAPEDIYTHPHKNILIRGLGGEDDLEVDVAEVQLTVGERVMLCSDGLWGLVMDDRIENILLRAGSPDLLVEELIMAANDAGGDDNIGIVVCDILPG